MPPALCWPCLMYHATPRSAADADYFAVAADALRGQLAVLQERGTPGVPLEQRLAGTDGTDTVAITFDDAHVSNYEVALPLFAEAGMAATIFVVVGWVGRPGYCSWAQLRELEAAGWSVQSHTWSHPFLSTLDVAALRRELWDARRAIEDRLGRPVVTLALPNGDGPAARHRHLVHEAGYRYVATSRWGSNGAAEVRAGRLNRYTVRRNTSLQRFTDILTTLPGALSREGVRLEALSRIRGVLGPTRYRALRRWLLREPATTGARPGPSHGVT